MEFQRKTLWSRFKRLALGADAALDSALHEAARRAADRHERFRSMMGVFAVSGGRRFVVEFASEGLAVGLAGLLLLTAMAHSALRDADEDFVRRQPLAVTFLDRYGSEIGKRGIRQDDSVRLEHLPDHLVKAALATEDRRFYEHVGIDPIGLVRALSVNARASGVVQGGSTITQQLAKNLFLNNERSLDRKIKEAFLAVWLEQRLSKNEILKLYLDRAYMGGGAFGVGAAAEYYFGKSVKDVTLAESAMLAGLFKAPTRFAPHVNLPAARARALDVLSNMVEAGFLTAGQVDSARRNPATPVDRARGSSPDYYLDWAFADVAQMAGTGAFGTDRVLIVKTQHDPAIQAKADQVVEQILRQHGPDYSATQAATVTMDVDGGVRAMVGGRDYGASQFNRATDAARQPGSSFKPFVYTAAMTQGLFKPNSIVTDAPVCIGNWCPNNYGRSYAGSMPLTVAMAKSINTIPVRMSIQMGRAMGEMHEGRAAALGRRRIIDTSRRMGLVSTPLTDSVALPIGAAEVTVLDMTAGYATLASGGRQTRPHAAIEVFSSNGTPIWRRDRDAPRPEQAIATGVAQDMNFILSKVPTEGTGRRAALDGVVSAGKTGTTNGYKDAWYVGYTGNLVTGVWFGNDDSSETNNMTGGSLPAMTFKEIMNFAHAGLELKPIPGVITTQPDPRASTVAGAPGAQPSDQLQQLRAGHLSRRSFEVITRVEDMFRSVQPGGGVDISAAGGPQPGFREASTSPRGGRIAEVR
ncbi:MAG: PBP1A family penicillin-binding protein [Bosea sp.]|nr:PBP1A family penicillin-binding protein [Bosea sp. (in: a-proteobacteria)]